jgi:hypothetical protein
MMRYYDHRRMNGFDVRRILTPPDPPRQPWHTVLELVSLIIALAALVALFGVMQ